MTTQAATRFSNRAAAFASAAFLTLVMLAGVDSLAHHDHHDKRLAHGAVAAKA